MAYTPPSTAFYCTCAEDAECWRLGVPLQMNGTVVDHYIRVIVIVPADMSINFVFFILLMCASIQHSMGTHYNGSGAANHITGTLSEHFSRVLM